MCITLIDEAALAANEGSIEITNTAFWVEDMGFNFVGTWRMWGDYPQLRAFELKKGIKQMIFNGDY